MLKCLLAAVSLERNANPVIHLFHLGEVAVAALASSEVPCILTILQRRPLACDVSGCGASKAAPVLGAETNAAAPLQTDPMHHRLQGLSRSPFLESFLAVYPAALDAVRETGVRDELQIDCGRLRRSA